MKKIFSIIAVLALLVTCTLTTCSHVHDENCGYNPETGEGCTHTCDEISQNYGYKDPNV